MGQIWPPEGGTQNTFQISSFTLSRNSVRAILPPFGCPFINASAKCAACSTVTLGGIGGSNGSTTTSTTQGLPDAKACLNTGRISSGLSTVKPRPPHASAYFAKFISCSSQPYSGLPKNTICSHLICPSVLFLMMTTLIGSLYLTAVTNSAMSMEKPPSPTKAMQGRSG